MQAVEATAEGKRQLKAAAEIIVGKRGIRKMVKRDTKHKSMQEVIWNACYVIRESMLWHKRCASSHTPAFRTILKIRANNAYSRTFQRYDFGV